MTSFETYILPPTPTEGEMPTLNPLVKVLDTDEVSYGKFALEPLTKGYGITIGNPLRRVLLSAIPGCAITWVKIEDITIKRTLSIVVNPNRYRSKASQAFSKEILTLFVSPYNKKY